MSDHRTHRAGSIAASLALILLAAAVLSACVGSHARLLTGSNLLGEQFQLNQYLEFIEGRAVSSRIAAFRWSGARYELTGGDASGVKFFRAESWSPGVLLIEGTDDKDYVYFLAHKLAEATYRVLPVNENNLGKATQKRLCVKQDRDNCTIETRAQLDPFVRASIGKPGPFTMIAVISTVAN
jgi:hypothetical protein